MIKIITRKMVVVLAVLAAQISVSFAQDLLRIDITQGNVDPLPIAINPFQGQEDQPSMIGAAIANVVKSDLNRSGLFQSINPAGFIEKGLRVNARPRFGDWRIINSQALVIGKVSNLEDGRISIEFRLWDVVAEQQMMGLQLISTPSNWRWVGHLVADAIYERLTGETGYFDSRIVYVDETGPKNRRVKRLAIMDQDGHNPRLITTGQSLALTPRFSPTAQEITYLSYANGQPRVFLLNIETGQQEIVGDFPGMTFAPRFSPDGQKIIMSLERNGNSNIFTLDLRTRITRRLTNTLAIDTAPCYAPDGERIVFESDRAGRQQLYVMDADGKNPVGEISQLIRVDCELCCFPVRTPIRYSVNMKDPSSHAPILVSILPMFYRGIPAPCQCCHSAPATPLTGVNMIDSGRKFTMTRGNFQSILSIAGQPEEMEMQR